jgi:hypothetical protein
MTRKNRHNSSSTIYKKKQTNVETAGKKRVKNQLTKSIKVVSLTLPSNYTNQLCSITLYASIIYILFCRTRKGELMKFSVPLKEVSFITLTEKQMIIFEPLELVWIYVYITFFGSRAAAR